MLNRLFLVMSLFASVVLAAMLFFTNPATVGPIGILLFFILTYIVVLGVITLIVNLFIRVVFRRKEMKWKDYAIAGILAFWPVTVLVFISVGTANMIVSLVGATGFVLLSIFLIRKV